MKKIITCLAVALCTTGAFAQYYLNTYNPAGFNPRGLNNDPEQPFGAAGVTAADGYTSIIANGTATLSWSANQTIPFPFSFNGTPVTQYKVSTSGVLTFTTAATTVPSFTNATLPNATIPDMSVMVWGLQQAAGGSTNDGVLSKTHGTAPYRQHWVNFASFGAPGASGQQWTYWGIVLEETTNNMYVVDLRTFNTPLSLTIGVQVNGTTATQVASAPNTPSFVTNGGNASDPTDNVYYGFVQGTKPVDDIELLTISTTNVGPAFTIGGSLYNGGSSTLNSFTLTWTADTGATLNTSIINVSIPPGSIGSFTHPTVWNTTPGVYDLKVYSALPNGNADPNNDYDTLSAVLNIGTGISVSRNPLLEEFTTAPCQFCPDGAVVVEQILVATPSVIAVGEHACFGTDAMTINEASTYCSAFGTGAPTACIDRVLYPGETNVAHGRGTWGANASSRASLGSPVDVTLTGTYNSTTRQVNVDLNANFVDYASGDIRVTLFVVEDHVRGIGSGYNQVNAYNTQAGHPYFGAGNPIVNYDHRHVLRDVYPTNDAWGDNTVIPSTPLINTTYTKNHTFTLNSAWNADSVYLVGFVNYFNTAVDQREVLNAVQVKLNNLVTGLDQVKKDVSSLSIYPNPTNNVSNIEFNLSTAKDVSLVLRDITGKEILAENFGTMGAGNQKLILNINSLTDGIYFATLQLGNEAITRKISVVK